MLTFDVLKTEGHARRGRMTLTHGVVETPVFMPVGTQASVKALDSDDMRRLGANAILANPTTSTCAPASKR